MNLGTFTTNLFLTEVWSGPVLSSMFQTGIGYRFEVFDSRSISGTVRQPTNGVRTSNIPAFRTLYLGDVETLTGFQQDEINGTAYRSAQAALQIRLMEDWFVSLTINGVSVDGFGELPNPEFLCG